MALLLAIASASDKWLQLGACACVAVGAVLGLWGPDKD